MPSSAGACFPAKLKGGSCDGYMSSAVEGNGALWRFEDGEVNEKKETKTTMRHIPTFEAFVNENKTADADLEQEIERLEAENPKAYKKEISRLKVRLSAVNMFKKLKK